jgi:hypothetical protein
MRICEWCGEPLGGFKPANTRFCSNAHRVAAYRADKMKLTAYPKIRRRSS